MKEIIDNLKRDDSKYQESAIEAARKLNGKINDLLFEEISNWMEDIDDSDYAPKIITYSFFLLAEFQDTRLMPLLIKLFNDIDLDIETLFDDGLIDTFYLIIGEVYDKDIEAYLSILNNPEINVYIRANFIRALNTIYEDKKISKEELITILKDVIDETDEEDTIVFTELTEVVKRTKLEGLVSDIESLYEEGLIDTDIAGTYKEFLQDLNDTNITCDRIKNALDLRSRIMFYDEA